jgi:predicted nucleic acid-binding protein
VKRYLLDTNVVSELRKPNPHSGVVAWMKSLKEQQLFLSAVTLGEFQLGVEKLKVCYPAKAREIEACVEQIAEAIETLSMDAVCFREWGRLICDTPDQLIEDAMIAVTARVHGLTVATRNTKGFVNLGVEVLNPFKV